MLARSFRRRKHLNDRRRTTLGNRTHRFFNNVAQAALFVAGRRVRTAVNLSLIQIMIIPAHFSRQLVTRFRIYAAFGNQMHTVANLRHLAEHNRCTRLNQHVRRIARRRIRRYAGKRIASAALHTNQQFGERQLLAAPLFKHLKFLFRHVQNRVGHRFKALKLLKNDDILRRIVLLADKHIHRQLFAAERNNHQLSAKVRMMTEIAQRTDRNLRFRRIDGNTASICMVNRYHIIHMRILRQNLSANALNSHIQYTLNALNRRLDTQNIARTGVTALRIAISHKRLARRFRQIGMNVHAVSHFIQRRRCGQAKHKLVDPRSLRDKILCISKHHTVTDNLSILFNIPKSNLMSLRNIRKRNDAIHQLASRLHFMNNNRDIVFRIDFDKCLHTDFLLFF